MAERRQQHGQSERVPQPRGRRETGAAVLGAAAALLVRAGGGAGAARADGAADLLEEDPVYADAGYSQLRTREKVNKVEDAVLAAKQKRFQEEQKSLRELEQNQRLCATPFGVDVVGITELVLVVGAITGGISARVRKRELETLNGKLRLINVQLREQARSGVIYAPGLTYAPPLPQQQAAAPVPEAGAADGLTSLSAAAAAAAAPAAADRGNGNGSDAPVSSSGPTCDVRDAARESLKKGKNLLAKQDAATAMVYFNKGAMLARQRGDMVLLRRARRGLAACKRMKGDIPGAIRHLERVLEMSKEMDDYTGDTDALGSLADLYSDIGDLEVAGQYYDMFLASMSSLDTKEANEKNSID